MKRILMIVMIAIAASAVAFGQMKPSKDKNNKAQAQLVTLEKQAWEAWKNRNGNFFQSFLSDDTVSVGNTGVGDKSQIVKAISGSDCEVKSYSLDDFKLTMLEKNTAILTYKAIQDVTCNGKTEPAMVWASSVYVKRGGKWLAAFHQETPAAQ